MNVYLIAEKDGDTRLWKAETMADALNLAAEDYVAEEKSNDESVVQNAARREFMEQIVESCTLIGELANP